MKCTFCGAELNDDAVFCTECGRAVEIASEPAKPEKNPGKVLGIISMILGILAPVVYCASCSLASIVAVPFALVSFILALIGKKKSKAAGYKNGMAKVGLILSLLTIILAIIVALILIALFVIFYVLPMLSGIGLSAGFIGLGILGEIL